MRIARLAVLFCLDSPLQRPDIGGILRLRSTGRELWRTERFFNRRGVNGGVADSLDNVMTMTGATGTVAQGWGAPHGEG